MKGLEGRLIGLAATRKTDAISELIRKNGGTSLSFPIQGQQWLEHEVAEMDVRQLLEGRFDWLVLTTGIGIETLRAAADQLDHREAFDHVLHQSNLAVRGSKTNAVLKEWGIQPELVSEDGTMDTLFEALMLEDLGDRRVFLQSYNQDDAVLRDQLEHEHMTVYLSQPYQYLSPDIQTLSALREAIMTASLDAVIFTSKTQVRNLFADSEHQDTLIQSFNEKVLGVAVGQVTAQALSQLGIKQIIQPDKPKMGAMVVTLTKYYQEQMTE
ncbi:uroporphyrinogen-III synthase [Tuberibacillus sp. Marseille-P3662]|uniref:uroporphyrinogen-III synthase n=1 Tax=Tuberibacillus sp. Marseille-P3662 TaxID=1965358 RepID=UPI000A1CC302|nr:uroporphyrinogen-III synthase [Tuberibacillus sp. Marseille-P3662]